MDGTSTATDTVVMDAADAMQHDKWMVAAWHLSGDPHEATIKLVLSMESFPHADMYEAVRLLRDQLEALMESDRDEAEA